MTDESRVAWSPDGRYLVVTGRVTEEDPQTHIWHDPVKVWSIDLAPDSQVVVQTPVDTWQALPLQVPPSQSVTT